MIVVGLTGGIASGKSTVSQIFKENGIPVICADELARNAVKPGSPALAEIRKVFGDYLISHDGQLDRVAMAKLVFNNESKRKLLESIIHPHVAAEKERLLSQFENQGAEIVVVDVPLLYEAGWDKQFDLVIVVYVSPPVQEQRIIERDHASRNDARARINAQMPIDQKRLLADRIVDNSGSIEETRRQVENIINELKAMAKDRYQAKTPGRSETINL